MNGKRFWSFSSLVWEEVDVEVFSFIVLFSVTEASRLIEV